MEIKILAVVPSGDWSPDLDRLGRCVGPITTSNLDNLPSAMQGEPSDCILSFLPPCKGMLRGLQESLQKAKTGSVLVYQIINPGYPPDLSEAADMDSFFSGYVFLPLDDFRIHAFLGQVRKDRKQLRQSKEIIGEIKKYREQKSKLLRIGAALSSESNLELLLRLILKESRSLVCADAGSIYLKQAKYPLEDVYSESADRIVFRIAQNDSVQMEEKSKEITIPIGPGTIAGYAAFSSEVLNIPDVYQIPPEAPFRFGKDFDRRFAYRTKSVLAVPMENRNKEIVGVLQLFNRKNLDSDRIRGEEDIGKIISFGANDEMIIRSLASQAAVIIEKAQLYHDIENLFKGFVESAVAAIEARDEPTSGHSRRVRAYALEMARAMNAKKEGPFREIYFDARALKEFEYAALLHDIGKIGVREAVLVKPTRLSPDKMEAIENRWRYYSRHGNSDGSAMGKLEDDLEFLKKLNKATFLNDENKERILAIRSRKYNDGNFVRPFLTDEEFENLSIPKGNLTEREREMINFHTECTRQILSRMPWTHELKGVIGIAAHHHEKMDGSGYPDRLKGEEIPIQSRILAVIDIFDALVAQDRPYKPPMPVEKALDVLRAEAAANHIDRNVLELFIGEKIYEFASQEKKPGEL